MSSKKLQEDLRRIVGGAEPSFTSGLGAKEAINALRGVAWIGADGSVQTTGGDSTTSTPTVPDQDRENAENTATDNNPDGSGDTYGTGGSGGSGSGGSGGGGGGGGGKTVTSGSVREWGLTITNATNASGISGLYDCVTGDNITLLFNDAQSAENATTPAPDGWDDPNCYHLEIRGDCKLGWDVCDPDGASVYRAAINCGPDETWQSNQYFRSWSTAFGSYVGGKTVADAHLRYESTGFYFTYNPETLAITLYYRSNNNVAFSSYASYTTGCGNNVPFHWGTYDALGISNICTEAPTLCDQYEQLCENNNQDPLSEDCNPLTLSQEEQCCQPEWDENSTDFDENTYYQLWGVGPASSSWGNIQEPWLSLFQAEIGEPYSFNNATTDIKAKTAQSLAGAAIGATMKSYSGGSIGTSPNIKYYVNVYQHAITSADPNGSPAIVATGTTQYYESNFIFQDPELASVTLISDTAAGDRTFVGSAFQAVNCGSTPDADWCWGLDDPRNCLNDGNWPTDGEQILTVNGDNTITGSPLDEEVPIENTSDQPPTSAQYCDTYGDPVKVYPGTNGDIVILDETKKIYMTVDKETGNLSFFDSTALIDYVGKQ